MRDTCHDELVRRAPFSDYTFPRFSLIRARRAVTMLRRVFGETVLEELPRPLFTVSAHLISSELVVHRRGPVAEAVGASMAIPGLAPPQPFGHRLLVDGGVPPTCRSTCSRRPGKVLSSRSTSLAALTIAPDVQGVALRDFSQLDRAIEAGRAAASAALESGGREILRKGLAA